MELLKLFLRFFEVETTFVLQSPEIAVEVAKSLFFHHEFAHTCFLKWIKSSFDNIVE